MQFVEMMLALEDLSVLVLTIVYVSYLLSDGDGGRSRFHWFSVRW
jgi:hypothetical protein